jgi:murein DD-endopeptidase MepM/ murein hydrolase activator NlpD
MIRRAGFLAAALLLLAAASDPKSETEHVVKPGETLSGIAQRAEVPRVLIIEANGLQPPYQVRAGQKLVIPRRRSHVVKDGETGLGIALDYEVSWAAIAAASGIDPKASVKPGQRLVIPTQTPAAAATPSPSPAPSATPSATPSAGPSPAQYAWPVEGRIRRAFVARAGRAAFHDGIDILAPADTAVRASAAGTVIFAGDGPKEYGKTVIIHHGNRWTTTYSFLSRITVKEGDRVRASERVGLVGETGLATEPQLHFEVRRNRVALDPERYLPKGD